MRTLSRLSSIFLSLTVICCTAPASQEADVPGGEKIENLDCTDFNADIQSVYKLVSAKQNNDVAVSVKANEVVLLAGGTVKFSEGYCWECVNPAVGVKPDLESGIYCWAIGGDYLLDSNGAKIPITQKQATVPIFKAEKQWALSLDNGKTWREMGAFEKGQSKPAVKSVTKESDAVTVNFADFSIIYLQFVEDPSYIAAEPSSVVFEKDGGSRTISLNSAKPWSVSAGNANWISITPSRGEGSMEAQTVNVAVAKLDGAQDRSADLVFTNGDRSSTVFVMQISPLQGLNIKADNGAIVPGTEVSINGKTYTTGANNYVEVPRSASYSVGYPGGTVSSANGATAKVLFSSAPQLDEPEPLFGFAGAEGDAATVPNPADVKMNPCAARLNIKASGYESLQYIDVSVSGGSALASDNYVSIQWGSAEPVYRVDAPLSKIRILMPGKEEATVNVLPGVFSSMNISVYGDDQSNPIATKTLYSVNLGRGKTTTVDVSYSPDPPVVPVDPPAPYGSLPTEGQVAWQRQEMIMFYHYGQATFSGWDGENSTCNGKAWSESLLLQNYKPTTIDTDQWVKVASDNGFKEIIITAKHHDGFCLWDNPESTTDVANANCSNHTDVLAGLREACNKYGVAMGIYLSPWDRMIEAEGVSTSVYETRFKNAAKDLMTKYAPVVEFWLDGNHAGNFNWSSVNQTIFNVNPQCVIFSNGGPGCRWVGNEDGQAGTTNWGTLNIKGRGLSPSNLPGSYGTYLSQGDKNGDSWCAAECDFSIQQIGDHNGWFYGANDSRKTAKQLLDIYYKSVGRNGVFLMNVPPSNAGVIDSKEIAIIEEFTRMRNAIFSTDLSQGAQISATKLRGNGFEPERMLDGDLDTYYATPDGEKTTDIEITLNGTKTFNRVMLQEYIPLGQRIENFTVQYKKNGSWTNWQSGTTVGHKRILTGTTITTDAVRIRITSALAPPTLCNFGLYNDTEL